MNAIVHAYANSALIIGALGLTPWIFGLLMRRWRPTPTKTIVIRVVVEVRRVKAPEARDEPDGRHRESR